MSRLRPAVAAACLAVLFLGAQPRAGLAQRNAELESTTAQSGSIGDRIVGAALAWGRGTLGWLEALIAAEHGQVVPVAPIAPGAPVAPGAPGAPPSPDTSAAPLYPHP